MKLCQACGLPIEHIMTLGYQPPVNDYRVIGEEPKEQLWLPTDLHYCPNCELVQLGYIADPKIVFPSSYPYTSGTTKVLRDNFADLASECYQMGIIWNTHNLVVDIGSNDGTLLQNFKERGCKILGVEPTDIADIATARNIRTVKGFFNRGCADFIKTSHGYTDLITCANCFAHMPDIHDVIEGILELLALDGVFVTESHYLMSLLDGLHFDTIYQEHLRFYSLTSLKWLLEEHGLEIFHVKPIPSHGGSIRVYAARRGQRTVQASVAQMRARELHDVPIRLVLRQFAKDVQTSRLEFVERLCHIKRAGNWFVGIGAPSRASTVIHYCGLDGLIDYVCEVPGSLKIGKYMPGTTIPVVEESQLFEKQPPYAILFSHHIADELIPKLKAKGYLGKFIMPCARAQYAEAA